MNCCPKQGGDCRWQTGTRSAGTLDSYSAPFPVALNSIPSYDSGNDGCQCGGWSVRFQPRMILSLDNLPLKLARMRLASLCLTGRRRARVHIFGQSLEANSSLLDNPFREEISGETTTVRKEVFQANGGWQMILKWIAV